MMNVDNPKKIVSGSTHQKSRRAVSPKPRGFEDATASRAMTYLNLSFPRKRGLTIAAQEKLCKGGTPVNCKMQSCPTGNDLSRREIALPSFCFNLRHGCGMKTCLGG